jgi:hypothetical protein
MRYFEFPRSANKAAVLTCLLALTSFLAGSWQAGAQTPTAVSNVQPFVASGGMVALEHHVSSKVLDGTAVRVSHYNPEQKLRLALGVHDPHMAAEEQFIKELVTKGSPTFHKFLTQEQWNARFAPAVEDEQAVVDWAESQGLTVTHRYPNRLLVDVEGTAGTIEKAFGVTINNYQVGDEVDFSADRNPVVPANLSGILQNVAGLNNIERVHRLGTSKSTVKGADYVPGPVVSAGGNSKSDGDPAKAHANQAGANMPEPTRKDSYPLSQINGNYAANPDNIQSSEGYDFNALQRLSNCCNVHNDSGGSPAVSSIALVGYGGFSTTDVNTFFEFYGMQWNITWYCIGGGACPAVDGEAPLDVEYAGAMSNSYTDANHTAAIYEYEITNNLWTSYEDAFNQIVSDDHAKVVSTSYGGQEATSEPSSGIETSTMHSIFNNMVAKGWTLIAASGDNGASDGCGDATAVDYPSSDPDVLAAGGTQLLLNDSGIYVSEIGWQGEFWTSADNGGHGGACANNHGGSTGGVSALFGAPSWQSSLVSPYYEWIGSQEYKVTGNTNRLVPDLSLTANPDVMGEWYFSGGSWQDEGGTSIVAPELAGFFAQYNTYLNTIGSICGSDGTTACTPAGLASPFIYDAGVIGAAHDPFYDMLSGCNDNDITTADGLVYYCAAPGFDLVTGWGSANMLQLAWGINYNLIPAYGEPVVTFNDTPATGVWYNTDQEVSWTVTTINTRSGGTTPPPGVAGFTQGWDSLPADPYSEPHSGEGNSFYSGPEYSYGTTGCLSFNGLNGCAGGSGQGCHTVSVEAWDNQGDPVAKTYGPLCYDTVAPTIGIFTKPATSGTVWVNRAVTVTLTPADPGGSGASGIYKTYYALNTGACYPGSLGACSVYSGPFAVSTQGQTYIYYFTEDNAGNYSNETYQWVSIDLSTPVTTASLSGTFLSGSTYKSAVGVTLSATDSGGSGIAAIYYTLDGGAQSTYTGTVTVSALGSHAVKYWSVNAAGTASATKSVSFGIDTPTTATLVATPNPSLSGQSVTMTATIKATLSGTPTGSVIFYNGATNLGTGTLIGGVATLKTTALPVGALTLQVAYAGSGNFIATNSPPFDETVQEKTTTTVTASADPAVYGSSVTLTATVKASVSGTPTGSVRFYTGATLLGSATLNGSAVGTLATSAIPEGANSITAVYSGDAINLTSASAAFNESITKAATAITIATTSHKTEYDQPVTFTATVTSAGGTPTGTVTFLASGTALGTVSLAGGLATFTTSTLALGSYAITASYPGSTDFNYSNSGGTSLTVGAETTTTKLTSSLNPSSYGQLVTFTATVTPGLDGVPAGTVNFLSNGTSIGTGTLTNGVATFATSQLPLGTNAITAAYAGSTDYLASKSSALSEVVDIEPTTTKLVSSVNPASFDQSVTFTATVSSAVAVKPTGTVTFLANGTSIGSATLTGGVAAFTTHSLAVGSNAITANYSGSTDFKASSAALSEVTDPTATTTTLTTSVNPSAFDQAITITASVKSADGVPTGSVTFYANGTSIGSASLASGVAALTTRVLAVGTNALTATYTGNADYKTSTSAAVSEVTKAASTTSKVVSSANPSTAGASVTFTAIVSPSTAGAVTGTVTFMDGTTSLGTKTLSSGVAALATTTLPQGSDSITVVYSGSADYLASTSPALTQTVNPAAAAKPVTHAPAE